MSYLHNFFFSISKTILVILLLFSVLSCTRKSDKSDMLPGEKTSVYHACSGINDFDELFTLEQTIQLDNNPEAFFSMPWTYTMSSDYIFVSDSRVVKEYFKDGSFKANFGRNGKGPGEFETVDNVICTNDNLILYDPSTQRISVYDKSSNQLINYISFKFYLEDIAVSEEYIVLLRKLGMGYKYDFDVYKISGENMFSGVLPASAFEENRSHLSGGGFKINVSGDKMYYVGADEYKIICYDITTRTISWMTNELPDVVKHPVIPAKLKTSPISERIKWMKENYTFLRGLYLTSNGLIILHVKNYFVLYDTNGNYIKYLKVDDEKKIFNYLNSRLYAITFPSDKTNSKLYVFSDRLK